MHKKQNDTKEEHCDIELDCHGYISEDVCLMGVSLGPKIIDSHWHPRSSHDHNAPSAPECNAKFAYFQKLSRSFPFRKNRVTTFSYEVPYRYTLGSCFMRRALLLLFSNTSCLLLCDDFDWDQMHVPDNLSISPRHKFKTWT